MPSTLTDVGMSYYPATVIAANEREIVVEFESSGHRIAFSHQAHNAAPVGLRQCGAKGFVFFPKVSPAFTASRPD